MPVSFWRWTWPKPQSEEINSDSHFDSFLKYFSNSTSTAQKRNEEPPGEDNPSLSEDESEGSDGEEQEDVADYCKGKKLKGKF